MPRRWHAGCLRLPRGPRAGGRLAAMTTSTHAVSLAWGAWVGAPASTRDTGQEVVLGCIIRALHTRQGLLPTPSHRSRHTTRLHNVVCACRIGKTKKGRRRSHPRQLPRPEGSAGATQRWPAGCGSCRPCRACRSRTIAVAATHPPARPTACAPPPLASAGATVGARRSASASAASGERPSHTRPNMPCTSACFAWASDARRAVASASPPHLAG